MVVNAVSKVVTDLSEATGWLRMKTIAECAECPNARQNEIMPQICELYGVEHRNP